MDEIDNRMRRNPKELTLFCGMKMLKPILSMLSLYPRVFRIPKEEVSYFYSRE